MIPFKDFDISPPDWGYSHRLYMFTQDPFVWFHGTFIAYNYYSFNYVLHCLLSCFVSWPCMAIKCSVQYGGGLLPDLILLTQGYYHRGAQCHEDVLSL